jgi:hypothetical protein
MHKLQVEFNPNPQTVDDAAHCTLSSRRNMIHACFSSCHSMCWSAIDFALQRCHSSGDAGCNSAEALIDVVLQCALFVSGHASSAASHVSPSIGIAPAQLKSLLSAFSPSGRLLGVQATALASASAQICRILSISTSARNSPATSKPPLPSPRTSLPPTPRAAAGGSDVGLAAERGTAGRGYVRSFGGGFRGTAVQVSDSRSFGWSPVSHGSRSRVRDGGDA